MNTVYVDEGFDLVESLYIVAHVYDKTTYIESFRYAHKAEKRFEELNQSKDIVELYELVN